jgi:hypothetical protein
VIFRGPVSGSIRSLGVVLRGLVSTCSTICFRHSHDVPSNPPVCNDLFNFDRLFNAPGENDIAPAFIGRDPPAPAVAS